MRRARKPWTDAEVRRLRCLYPRTRMAEIACLLGRPLSGVTSKAKELGLRKPKLGRKWTAREIRLLRQCYAETPAREIAAALHRKRHEIYYQAGLFHLRKSRSFKSRFMKQQVAKHGPLNGSPWTRDQVERLRELYPAQPTKKVAKEVGHSLSSCFQMAKQLGLKKAPGYLRAVLRRLADKLKESGKIHRFPKGHVPANKGLRRPGYAPGRMRETQFKKGQKCRNWLPIGTEIFKNDGYLYRKLTDTGYPPRDWKQVHRMLWEEHYGPIPAGYRVKFIDGDRRHVVLGNFCLVSRADLARLNVMWSRYPRALCEVIQLRGALNRRINRRLKDEKQIARFA